MDILSRIISSKRARLEAAEENVAALRQRAEKFRTNTESHRLRRVLQDTSGFNVIAEFKRRSPSKGLIRDDRSAAEMASLYQTGGAAAVSVLTEEDYFQGSLQDLAAVRKAVALPVLRKDFILDERTVYEAAAYGADAILLIVAVLDDESLIHLRKLAEDELGLDALVEVHTHSEIERALKIGASIVGINNRDLRTFKVSLETSLELAEKYAGQALLVSESGLATIADLKRLDAAGFHGYLLGEVLMRADDPVAALRELCHSKVAHQ